MQINKYTNKKSGFTLLELLVVIAIIAVLISMATVSYSSAQRKSRDSRRKSDLKSIQAALEQYYADHSGVYIIDAGCNPGVTYLPGGMPTDPKSGVAYTVTSIPFSGSCPTAGSNAYCICALLEGETNTTTGCNGGAVPSGYTGAFCVRSLQ